MRTFSSQISGRRWELNFLDFLHSISIFSFTVHAELLSPLEYLQALLYRVVDVVIVVLKEVCEPLIVGLEALQVFRMKLVCRRRNNYRFELILSHKIIFKIVSLQQRST